jgi:hypothetical protein
MAVTGGGAAAVTQQIINMMWENAQEKSSDGAKRISEAIALGGAAPKMVVNGVEGEFGMPSPPAMPNEDPSNGAHLYDSARDQLLQMIQNGMNTFVHQFFPDIGYYEDAVDWCDRALTQGGSGINAYVEDALWQRERARSLGESERAEDEAMATWSNRGFPLPPGALTNQVNQIRLAANRTMAETSRTISIEGFKAELENVRFAAKTLIDERKVALDSMGDYIKTLMLGPQIAMELATKLSSIRGETARNMATMYSAQVEAAKPAIQLAIADANVRSEGNRANLNAQIGSIESRVKAAITGAQMLGTMGAAGINAINAQASISGNDSSSI